MTDASVRIALETRGDLARFLANGDDARDQTQRAVEHEVTGLMQSLGVPGRPEVVVSMHEEDAAPSEWATIRVGDSVCRHSDEGARWVAAYIEGTYPDGTSPHPLAQWLGGNGGASASASLVADFLGLVAADAVRACPSVLLGERQIELYGATLPAPHSTESAALGTLLRGVLDLSMSIAPVERVAHVLRDGTDADPAATCELLADELAATTVELLLPDEYRAQLEAQVEGESESMLEFARRGLFEELGILVPAFSFGSSADLRPGSFAVRINDLVLLPYTCLDSKTCLANAMPADLETDGLRARPAVNPGTGLPAALVDRREQERLNDLGYTTWDAAEYVVLVLANALRQNAKCFIHQAQIEAQLETLETTHPALVRAARATLPTWELTAAMRALVAEQVSLRDLRLVLERVVDLAYDAVDGARGEILDDGLSVTVVPDDRPRERLLTFLRAGLRRQIMYKRTRGTSTLVVYLLDEDIENRLRQGGGENGPQPIWALAETDARLILRAVAEELAMLPATVAPPCILAWDDIRSRLQETVRPIFPRLFVLGYQDVTAEVNVQPVARLSLS
jgi:hypothetical protein